MRWTRTEERGRRIAEGCMHPPVRLSDSGAAIAAADRVSSFSLPQKRLHITMEDVENESILDNELN